MITLVMPIGCLQFSFYFVTTPIHPPIYLSIYLLSVQSKAQRNILRLKSPLVSQESPGTVSPPWVISHCYVPICPHLSPIFPTYWLYFAPFRRKGHCRFLATRPNEYNTRLMAPNTRLGREVCTVQYTVCTVMFVV